MHAVLLFVISRSSTQETTCISVIYQMWLDCHIIRTWSWWTLCRACDQISMNIPHFIRCQKLHRAEPSCALGWVTTRGLPGVWAVWLRLGQGISVLCHVFICTVVFLSYSSSPVSLPRPNPYNNKKANRWQNALRCGWPKTAACIFNSSLDNFGQFKTLRCCSTVTCPPVLWLFFSRHFLAPLSLQHRPRHCSGEWIALFTHGGAQRKSNNAPFCQWCQRIFRYLCDIPLPSVVPPPSTNSHKHNNSRANNTWGKTNTVFSALLHGFFSGSMLK